VTTGPVISRCSPIAGGSRNRLGGGTLSTIGAGADLRAHIVKLLDVTSAHRLTRDEHDELFALVQSTLEVSLARLLREP